MFVKPCSICKQEKPPHEYARHPLTGDGTTSACRACGGVDVEDYLTFVIATPTHQFELSAAAIVNQDIGAISYYMGRLKMANALYPVMLREMARLIAVALDDEENNV